MGKTYGDRTLLPSLTYDFLVDKLHYLTS